MTFRQTQTHHLFLFWKELCIKCFEFNFAVNFGKFLLPQNDKVRNPLHYRNNQNSANRTGQGISAPIEPEEPYTELVFPNLENPNRNFRRESYIDREGRNWVTVEDKLVRFDNGKFYYRNIYYILCIYICKVNVLM